MTFNDTVHLALRNLRQAKLRTSLTTMGVSIGIASLAGMVSLGVGLQDQLVAQFMQSGMFDTITVSSGGGFPGIAGGGDPFGGRGRGGRSGRGGRGASGGVARPSPVLDDTAVQQLAALTGVKDVYPSVSVSLDVTRGDFAETMNATGVPMSSRDEGVYRTMTAGAFFASASDDSCLISLDAAKRIDGENPTALVGQTLTLGYMASHGATDAPPAAADVLQLQRMTATCRISGIVEREAASGAGPLGGRGGGSLMMPLGAVKAIKSEQVANVQTLLRRPSSSNTYQTVTVKVQRVQATQDVEEQVKAMGFAAFSLNDGLEGAKRAFIILDIVLSLIGSIALAVSSLGIVNTMVMSILERTREIGIMKAIGASDADIRRIFLVEASAIGVMGGVAGVLLGWLVGRVINFGANIYIQSQGGTATTLFSLPFWLVGGALAFALIVSVIAGSYPANRAARLEPMSALRHD